MTDDHLRSVVLGYLAGLDVQRRHPEAAVFDPADPAEAEAAAAELHDQLAALPPRADSAGDDAG